MPCLSKPAALAVTMLLMSAGVDGREHERLQWRVDRDDKNYFIADLYFRYNGNGAWGYSTGPSNPWWPGCSPLINMWPGKNYRINFHNYARGPYRAADVEAAGVEAADNEGKHATSFAFGTGFHVSRNGGYNNPVRVDSGNWVQHQYNVPSYHADGLHTYNPWLSGNQGPQFQGGAFGLMHIGGNGWNRGPQYLGNPYDINVQTFFASNQYDRYWSIGHNGKNWFANGEHSGFHETSAIKGQYFRLQAGHQWGNGLGPQIGQFLANDACQVYELGVNGVFHSQIPRQPFGRPQYNYNVFPGQRYDWAVQCNRAGRYPAYSFGGRTVAWFNVRDDVRPGSGRPFNNFNQQFSWNRPGYLSLLDDDNRPRVVTTVGALQSFHVDDSNRFNLNGQWGNSLGFGGFQWGAQTIQNFQFNNRGKNPFTFGFNNYFQVVQPGGCGQHHIQGGFYDALYLPPGVSCNLRTRFMDYSGQYPFWSQSSQLFDQGMYNRFMTPFGAKGSFEERKDYRNAFGQRREGSRREDMSEVEDTTTIAQSTWIIAGAGIAATAFGIVASVLVVRRRRTATPDAGFQEMECPEVEVTSA